MSGIINSAGSKSGVIGTTELDYEEGTWTAKSAGGSISDTARIMQYTKIGNLVHLYGQFRQGVGQASGDVSLYDLPFINESNPTDGNSTAVGSLRITSWDITSGGGGCVCMIPDASTAMLFYENRDNAAATRLTRYDNAYAAISITYRTP